MDPASVTIKVRYQEPWREIFYDLDGTLTGKGANSYATAFWQHNVQPECEINLEVYDGILCDSRVQVRRIVFYKYIPDIFNIMDLKVLPFDDTITSKLNATSKKGYIENITNYSVVPFRAKARPERAWAIPIVTGHKYRMHWQKGLDFEQMQVDLSPHWKPTDKDIYLIHNFTDVRAKIEFLTGGDSILNKTLLTTSNALRQTGTNVVYNDTSVREMHYVINGKNKTRSQLVIKGYRCDGPCLPAISKVNITGPLRLWSEPTTWKTGKVPLEGEDAEVQTGYDVLYDVVESPIYRYVQINGRVTFKLDAPKLHLRAKYIFVRAGELIIGNSEMPYSGEAKITLYGDKQDEHIVYDNAIEAGNKVLANTGLISMIGTERSYRSRLLRTANPRDTQIVVEPDLDWTENDFLALASTTVNWDELDYAKVLSYDKVTGVAILDRKLSYYHWGAPVSTGAQYSGVDMRGEVMLMSRNIKIQGNDTDAWGCQIVTSDFEEGNLELRVGSTYMTNVEIANCSQYDTYKAALRFEEAKLGESIIKNSSLHHGLGLGINVEFSNNISFVGNNMFNFIKYGVNIMTSNDISLDNNWIVGVYHRDVSSKSLKDAQGGVLACAKEQFDKCKNIRMTNNVVSSVQSSGVDTVGYATSGHDCGDYKNIIFKDNVAHSIEG